jgi:hypothetical protein
VPVEPEVLEVFGSAPDAVVQRMEVLAAAGRGWVNLQPVPVDEESVPPDRPGFLSALGPALPLCTWSPGEAKGRRRTPASIGIQHRAGTKAALVLTELGPAVPPCWRVTQDHPRRGIVAEPPADLPLDDVLAWLLEAGERLSVVPVTGRWAVHVFDPAR